MKSVSTVVSQQLRNRMAETLEQLNHMLKFYETPPQFRDRDTGEEDDAMVLEYQREVAEAIILHVPIDIVGESFTEHLSKVVTHIRRTHRGAKWPTVQEFSKAAVTIAKGRAPSRSPSSDWNLDSYRIEADRIRRGDKVSEFYLSGESLAKLKDEYGITDSDVAPYLKTLDLHEI